MIASSETTTPDDEIDNTKSEYEQMVWKMQYDTRWLKEVSLGKRVGLYRFSETIGSGNFSQVKLAVHLLTRDKVAVKIIDKTKLDVKTRKMINQEIKSMEAIHHPNIIRLLEVMDSYRKLYLVVEHAAGGQLSALVCTGGALAELRARLYFRQLALAVGHMHKLGFVHRDIKAENVFISSNNTVKLGDFGFSAQLQNDPNEKLNTFCGSPPYAAPELYRDAAYAGRPVDSWALGVLLYFILTAALPFDGVGVGQIKNKILEGKFHMPETVPAQGRYIIEHTLVQNAEERLTLPEMIACEWLQAPPPAQPSVRKNSLMSFAKKFRRNQDRPTEARRRSILRDFELKRIPEVFRSNKTNDISCVDRVDKAGTMSYPKGKSFDLSSLPSSRPEHMLQSGDGEPSELGRFVMSPTAVTELEQVCLVERMARERLARLGIDSKLLLDHLCEGSRSPVIGAYRCIINRILEEQHVWNSIEDPDVVKLNLGADRRESKTNKRSPGMKIARICIIL